MDKFLSETNFDFKGKTVLVRVDTDVDLRSENNQLVVDENFRLRSAIPTIKFLLERGVGKIILMGHLDKPGGRVVENLELESVGRVFNKLLNPNFKFSILNFQTIFNDSISNLQNIYQLDNKIFLLENLRFNAGEEENDEEFAKKLASLGDVYINEAFGASHREHASIVGIPKFLPSFLGLRFEEEMGELARLLPRPCSGFGEAGGEKHEIQRPLIFVLGGSKSDKLSYLGFLSKWCDRVLVGGKLPLLAGNLKFKIENLKFVFAKLKNGGRDLDNESILKFKKEIALAKTIVWAGPMGVYEEKENQKGSFEIAKAIAESKAFKVAGGGDTHRILSLLNLWEKFDFVSVGGGAMLYFLKEGTLPGIEAVIK